MITNEIKPYYKNTKKHPRKQVEQIGKSIQEFGMNQPIVVDKNGVIIVGHGRYFAMKEIGMEILPEHIKVVDMTEDRANAYRIADNKLNESEWLMGTLKEEWMGLPEELRELTGFDFSLGGGSGEGEVKFTTEIMEANNYIVFTFDNIMDFQMIEDLFELETQHSLDSKKGYERAGTGRVINGKKLLEKLQ